MLISTDLRASDELTEEKINLLNNLAECLLKLERWRDAEKRATEVLEMKSETNHNLTNPNNTISAKYYVHCFLCIA